MAEPRNSKTSGSRSDPKPAFQPPQGPVGPHRGRKVGTGGGRQPSNRYDGAKDYSKDSRLASEFVAGVLVGGLIGYGLDYLRNAAFVPDRISASRLWCPAPDVACREQEPARKCQKAPQMRRPRMVPRGRMMKRGLIVANGTRFTSSRSRTSRGLSGQRRLRDQLHQNSAPSLARPARHHRFPLARITQG